MKMTIVSTMTYVAVTATMLKTPMSMMMILMAQTLLSITLMNKTFNSSWFPMVTFLMMVGGILIIFMYMSSITSNKKFKTNMKILIASIMLITMAEEMMAEFQMNETQMLINKTEDMSMSKMYNKSMSMTMLMILYLLLTMLSINKIIKNFEGPLRAKTYEQNITKK